MSSTKRRIIFDCDVGTDDAFALLALLDADKKGLIKLEAIVCSMGNASLNDVCRNVVRILELFNRTDIPLYKGASDALIPWKIHVEGYHGKDGFGDIEHETEPDISIIQKTPAALAYHEIVTKNPNEITVVTVGPVTNVALAIKLFDDFVPNVKEMFIMGGNHLGYGNVSDAAEYNFYKDPESAYIVLDKMKQPITVLTWETCNFTEIDMNWRFNVLGKLDTPFIRLMNRAEKNLHRHAPLDMEWTVCDGLLVISMLYPEAILVQTKYNASVELHGSETRGQCVIKRYVDNKKDNVSIIEKIDYDFIKRKIFEIVEDN